MANPAINAAIMVAAQQQAATSKSLTDQLTKAGATNPRAAAPLDLGQSGAKQMLDYLIKKGHVREAGGERYWLDQDAMARSKANAVRVTLILIVFLLSAGASLLALTVRG